MIGAAMSPDPYERLRKSYANLFHIALKRLREQAELLGDRIAKRQVLVPVDVKISETESSFGMNISSQPQILVDWRWFTIRLTMETLQDSPECIAAVAALAEFVDVNKYAGIKQTYFFNPLADLVAQEKGLEIGEEALQKKIDEIVRCIKTDSYTIEVAGVLSAFWSEASDIIFGDCRIKKIDMQEMCRYWEESSDVGSGSNAPTIADYLLQTTCPAMAANNGNEYLLARNRLDQGLFVLRLFKGGPVSINSTSSRRLAWAPVAEPGGQLKRAYEIRKYRLSQADILDLSEYWRKYAALFESANPRVKLAVDRFTSSYNRVTPQDTIIDVFIGLESLLIEDNQELSFKLRMRMANLLGGSRQERLNTFDDIKAGYNMRSTIVHGNHPAKSVKISSCEQKVALQQFAEEMLRYLAKALMRVADIQREYPADDVITRLDEMARGGSEPA